MDEFGNVWKPPNSTKSTYFEVEHFHLSATTNWWSPWIWFFICHFCVFVYLILIEKYKCMLCIINTYVSLLFILPYFIYAVFIFCTSFYSKTFCTPAVVVIFDNTLIYLFVSFIVKYLLIILAQLIRVGFVSSSTVLLFVVVAYYLMNKWILNQNNTDVFRTCALLYPNAILSPRRRRVFNAFKFVKQKLSKKSKS